MLAELPVKSGLRSYGGLPSNVVVAGTPAKYVCSIEEYVEKNKKYNTDTKGLSKEKKKELLLSLDESKFVHKSLLKVEKP